MDADIKAKKAWAEPWKNASFAWRMAFLALTDAMEAQCEAEAVETRDTVVELDDISIRNADTPVG